MISAFAVSVIFKIWDIQNGHDQYWKKLSQRMTEMEMEVVSERGNIFSTKGRILATTIPTFELRIDMIADGLTDTLWSRNKKSLCEGLTKYLHKNSPEKWEAYLQKGRDDKKRHLLIAKDVDFQTFKRLREIPLFKLGSNKSGLIVYQRNSRKLPFGMLAKRTIGYVRDNDDRVKVGIEGMYDEELSGEKKTILMQKVAGGVMMPIDENSEFGSKPGLDVITTIDVNLQDIAEKSLMKSLVSHKADHGSVVLMNVKTGEIKAIANLGKDKKGRYREILNYAVGELNNPGSVMKLASIIALIDKGYCDENYMVDLENGRKKYYDAELVDDKPISGSVSLTRAFALSSNVGISKPVVKFFKNDKQAYADILEKLYLTKPIYLGIKGEVAPKLPPVNKWSGITLPWLSIGYEIRTTPLQMLCLYAAVANNGKLMKPYLIKEVRDNDKVVERFKPEVLQKRICKESTVKSVRAMLESVVDSGTASSIRNIDYKIAGKTGTNLIPDKKLGYKRKIYQASFAGYFPARDPHYACIVVVNRPHRDYGVHGSQVAAPVFKDIADRLYSSDLDIHPNINDETNQRNLKLISWKGFKGEVDKVAKFFDWKVVDDRKKSEWVSVNTIDGKVVQKSINLRNKQMPSVINMNVKDAIYILESIGMKVYVEGKGKVKWQSIKAGQKIYRGSQVKLNLG